MKQIIEDVLQAEERMGEVLKQARAKASEIKRAADQEIAESVDRAKRQAQEIVQAAVERANAEAQRFKEERLGQADRDNEALLNGNPETVEPLVDAICNLLLTTERKRDAL